MADDERDREADLALLNDLAADSELTETEVSELTSRIDEHVCRRWDSTG